MSGASSAPRALGATYGTRTGSATATRRRLRGAHLEAFPYCACTLTSICGWYATDVHEIIGRGVRPGAELEPQLFISLCRPCHGFITDHPRWSRSHGYLLRSGEEYLLDQARELRDQLPCDLPPSRRHLCTADHLDDTAQD